MEKKTLISLFIAAIMILSIFGFVIDFAVNAPEQQKLEYGKYKFVQTDQEWRTQIKGKTLYFNYFPTELEDIELDDKTKSLITSTRALYVTYDPNSEFAELMAQIQFYMEQKINQFGQVYIMLALTNSTDYSLPEITCANATSTVPVLEFRQSNSTSLMLENNCIIATADSPGELPSYAEKIIYTIIGVIE